MELREEDFEEKVKEHERFKARVFQQVSKRIDDYLLRAAMNFDLCAECESVGDGLADDIIELVAPGLLKRERDFGLSLGDSQPANPDELLCFINVRLNVGFVLGFLLAARVLDGRDPQSYGQFKQLLADKLGHAFDCELCQRKGDHHGNQQ